MQLKTAIGDTIRILRNERGLSMRDMTPYVALGHISEVERGIKSASPEILEEIAKGLHISNTQLIKEIYEYLERANNAGI